MRIVLVSGHYPPNFVSGGSLQPQRIARGLRARGHDVAVYAGRIDPERAPLDTWDEVDETGLPVRWIVTTPWDNWSDRRNWDCPPVHQDFRRFLAEFQPDVVHLHDLQMLGASLVEAAKQVGAKVVVTMHDYWWFCPRLFLVDKRLNPCSLVVDAGTCHCESGRLRLLSRKGQLAKVLDDVDLVLTPSSIMGRVLAANGIAPDLLEVDENGLPDEDLLPFGDRSPRRSAAPPVRFAYAGGRHQLKGSAVMLRAAAELRDLSGWHLTTYGIDDDLDEALGLDLDDLPIQRCPPFDANTRDAVFQAIDVLVVPSVARESYSIVTREALGRGVPVICSDTLGPEEVVADGENGIVVRAHDHEMLAAAMRAVVEDPALLRHLRDGAAQPVNVRSIGTQVLELEKRYQALLDTPATPTTRSPRAAHPSIQRVVFAAGIQGAPLRYRVRLPAEALALRGVRSQAYDFRNPRLREAVDEADALYVYRVPASPEILGVIDQAKRRGIPVLFDVDDLIFDPQVAETIPALKLLPDHVVEDYLDGVRRYRTTLEHSDGYVGSTRMLVDHARATTGLPAERFENGVGLLLARASDRACALARPSGPVRLGYFSGTITHDLDWAEIEPAVIDILEHHPDVQLVLGGLLTTGPELERFASRIERAPFVPWLQLPRLLHSVDINLAPLQLDLPFNDAKSAIKWLEAGLVVTPTVASATEPYRDAVEHGVTGMLATSTGSWVDAIDRLVGDERLRASMGERARRAALLRWSPHLQGRRFLELLEHAHEWRAPTTQRPPSDWEPVSRSEPFEPRTLEPYTASRLAPAIAVYERQHAALDWAIRQAKESVETEGVVATARNAPRALVRSTRFAVTQELHRARTSRPRELLTYSRRMVHERGLSATLDRGVRFLARRLVALLIRLPGIRHARAAYQRLHRSIERRGVGGSLSLGAPVVRHHVVHSANRARARVNGTVAALGARVRPRR